MRLGLIIPVLAAVLVVSGVGFYTVISPFGPNHANSSSSTSGVKGASGYQFPDGTPEGSWAAYLGYIPQGYKVIPLNGASAHYPCPSGMNATQCAVFDQTCGNGVCDPNETCNSCPLDCPTTGAQVCDPFTGRGGSPASICQQIITGPGA